MSSIEKKTKSPTEKIPIIQSDNINPKGTNNKIKISMILIDVLDSKCNRSNLYNSFRCSINQHKNSLTH